MSRAVSAAFGSGLRVLSACLYLGLAAQLTSTPVHAETPKSVLVMAKALDDLISLDPAEVFEFSGAELVANLYRRLFRPNPDDPATPLPDLVADWQVSEDRLTYLFTLRDDVMFHSGRPVTAADAVFSLKRAVTLNRTPAFILTQLGLDRARIDQQILLLDPWRFQITVEQAFAPSFVINALSAGITSVIDSKAFSEDGVSDADLRHHAFGAGAYRLKRWQPGEYVILDRADTERSDTESAPDIGNRHQRRVVIRDIREPTTQRLLLEKGDIDVARNLAPDQVRALAKNPALRIVRAPGARLYYLALNQTHEALAQPETREALRYLVDYHGIVGQLLEGHAIVHQAFLPRGFAEALGDTPFEYRPDFAKTLLAEAGLGDGLALRMDVRADGTAMQIAQALQASMAAAGVSLEIVPGDGKQVLSRYRARKHDIFFGQWGPDYLDPHSNASVFARNPNNNDDATEKTLAWRNGWEIPDLTERTEAAVFEDDPRRRQDIYRQIQEEVRTDSPFIILFQEQQTLVSRAEIGGLAPKIMADLMDYRRIVKE